MENETFFFVPVTKRKRIESITAKPTVSILPKGYIYLNRSAQRNFFPVLTYVMLYLDEQKRTVAIRAFKKTESRRHESS